MSFGYAMSNALMLNETEIEVVSETIDFVFYISANFMWNNHIDYQIAK